MRFLSSTSWNESPVTSCFSLVPLQNLEKKLGLEAPGSLAMHLYAPEMWQRMPVTTRIIIFLAGDPYTPSFPLLLGGGDNPRQKHVHHLPYGIMVSFVTDSTTLPQEKNCCNLPSCTSPSSATRWNTWVATKIWELHRTFPDTPSKHSKHIQTWRCHM